ncbi:MULTISPECIES: site-specific integrase [unclassified Yoonia]|uniref:site-specific integrase n=1 Tax=unclassified Yoonia TaxID=2629118 RepID=UPI002AFF2C69|nr:MULTISPECIES: site-specific integrase [unclassified Yoonia]
MGTIKERKRKDGTSAFLAEIVIKKKGQIVHRQAQTFDRRPAAVKWIDKKEAELKAPGGLDRVKKTSGTLGDAIGRYTEDITRIGRTKAQVLRAVLEYDIANIRLDELRSTDIVDFARELRGNNERAASTVLNYISHIGGVISVARSAWGFDVDRSVVQDALSATRRLQLTAKSSKRDRRPTMDELDKILEHFQRIRARRPSSNPMDIITAFAIFSTRRQAEICRITWDDYEPDAGRILVRNMKDPGDNQGIDTWVEIVPEAAHIIAMMPRRKNEPRIFPYSTDAVSAAFTRACKMLEIEDLHFHDLRHEGISRLFEMGRTIPQVASVSGHRSWQSLQRYSHLRSTGDRFEDWPWFEKLTPAR